jgi:hypothetical protein
MKYLGWTIRKLRDSEKTYFHDGSTYDYVATKGKYRIEGVNPESLKYEINYQVTRNVKASLGLFTIGLLIVFLILFVF